MSLVNASHSETLATRTVTSVVNRYYDPTTDQFLSIDPDVATTDQPYVFANDDPLNAEDPLGLADFDIGAPEGFADVFNASGLTAGVESEGTGALSDPFTGNASSTVSPESVKIEISEGKYPESAAHITDAQQNGQPSELTINRAGASTNRVQALRGYQSMSNLDRDEYPPAVTSEGGEGASVRYINSGDNRGAGASIGNQIRGLPDGTLIHIVVVR